MYNHYNANDDTCDPVVNRPIVSEAQGEQSATIWSNGYEHKTIQGANDDLFFAILRNQIGNYQDKASADQCITRLETELDESQSELLLLADQNATLLIENSELRGRLSVFEEKFTQISHQQ